MIPNMLEATANLQKRVDQLENELATVNHNLDMALDMIAQVQQAILEVDSREMQTHAGVSKLTHSLLKFWKNYTVKNV